MLSFNVNQTHITKSGRSIIDSRKLKAQGFEKQDNSFEDSNLIQTGKYLSRNN